MFMKKFIYILLFGILLTGCGEKEVENIKYDDNYYQIAKPYKDGVGSYSIASYDKNEVDLMLMRLSSNYFKTNNSFYQSGQYLTTKELKELINLYNQTDNIKVDKVEIDPNYIISIYEQNYLNYQNELKGISLAIVVNNKQYYEDSYKIIDEEIVINYAKEKAVDLVKYMRNKEGLQNVKIVVGIYLESNNTLSGSFKYVGETNNDSIDFKYINYNYQYLDSNYVMNNDTDTYNTILALNQNISNYSTVYLSPIGLYQNDKLVEVNLTLTKGYFKNSEILSIIGDITSNLNTFDSSVKLNVYFKNNNDIKAYVTRKNNELETFIMEE